MAQTTSTAGLEAFFAAHSALIESLYVQTDAERWSVSRTVFSAALGRSAAHRFGDALPDSDAIAGYVGGLHVQEVALACALRAGSESAWEEFVAGYRPLLYAAARAIVGGDEGRARELADSIYAELYGVDRSGGERRSLLEYFHGRSKLSTWLRTVLAQRYVDLLRAGKRTDSLDAAVEMPKGAALVKSTRQAAQATLEAPDRNRLLPPLRAAVAGSIAALAAADRLVLSLYYVQEMTLAQIARLRGVHEATISRQLERLRKELRQAIEKALATGNGDAGQHGLSPAEVRLCMAYALDDWPFDLGKALAGGNAPRPSEEVS